MPESKNFVFQAGDTFQYVVRWETSPVVYKPITAITQTAPVRLTVPLHGVVDGWRVAISAVKGMTQINAANAPPKIPKDYHTVKVVDANTLELNDVNSLLYKAYTSGGTIQYNTPVSLAGFVARMSIKDKIGGTELFRLDSTLNNRITVDDTAKAITLTISATDTAALTFSTGVYDLEMQSPTGVVTKLYHGTITVNPEVTTT